jgi:tRNA pseudouridine38-40 synthase
MNTRTVFILEYDGTRYHGSQVQHDLPTIQGELEKALEQVTGARIRTSFAGRTDQGVHARGQVVACDTSSTLEPMTIARALNHYLPEDIAIKDAFAVNQDFDPRRDALSREYCYYIWNDVNPSPLRRWNAHHVPQPLDVTEMDKACQVIVGTHDFAPFASSLEDRHNTVRSVYRANTFREGSMVTCHIEANAFLPHQVRNTVGALLQVGLGKMDVSDFERILGSNRSAVAGPTAPPHGLCLLKVNYNGKMQ